MKRSYIFIFFTFQKIKVHPLKRVCFIFLTEILNDLTKNLQKYVKFQDVSSGFIIWIDFLDFFSRFTEFTANPNMSKSSWMIHANCIYEERKLCFFFNKTQNSNPKTETQKKPYLRSKPRENTAETNSLSLETTKHDQILTELAPTYTKNLKTTKNSPFHVTSPSLGSIS